MISRVFQNARFWTTPVRDGRRGRPGLWPRCTQAVRTISLVGSVSALSLLGGCGRPDHGVSVGGTVAFPDGSVVESATIAFEPVDGGARITAPVTKGRYSIAARGGVPPGTYHVLILPPQPEIEDLHAAADMRQTLRGTPIDPAFSRPGELTATIGNRPNEQNFEVRPGPRR